jgi:hypothetical protein
MRTFKLRHEIRDIPDTENGVYWFKLRFPTATTFGLSDAISAITVTNLAESIATFSHIINRISIRSRVQNKSALMLRSTFNFEFSSTPLLSQERKLTSLLNFKSAEELKVIVDLIRYAVNELPPIYVGIADRQSFKERFDQHFCGDTSLSNGLAELGIGWDCLNFTIFPQHTYKIKSNREIEQIFHLILRPVLSRG